MDADKGGASVHYDTQMEILEALQERNALENGVAEEGPGLLIAALCAAGMGLLLWAGIALVAYWGLMRLT
jgi:hypothetical protein